MLSFEEVVKRLCQRGWKKKYGGCLSRDNRAMYTKEPKDVKRTNGKNLIGEIIFTRGTILPKRKIDIQNAYIVYPDIVKEQSEYYVSLLDGELLANLIKEVFGRYRSLEAELSVSDNGLWIVKFERSEGAFIVAPVDGVLEPADPSNKYYDVVSWDKLPVDKLRRLEEMAEALTGVVRGGPRRHEILSKHSTDVEFMKIALRELL